MRWAATAAHRILYIDTREADDKVEQTDSQLVWRKSRYCGNGACVLVAQTEELSLVKDSKDPDGPALAFSHASWLSFLSGVRAGEFD